MCHTCMNVVTSPMFLNNTALQWPHPFNQPAGQGKQQGCRWCQGPGLNRQCGCPRHQDSSQRQGLSQVQHTHWAGEGWLLLCCLHGSFCGASQVQAVIGSLYGQAAVQELHSLLYQHCKTANGERNWQVLVQAYDWVGKDTHWYGNHLQPCHPLLLCVHGLFCTCLRACTQLFMHHAEAGPQSHRCRWLQHC